MLDTCTGDAHSRGDGRSRMHKIPSAVGHYSLPLPCLVRPEPNLANLPDTRSHGSTRSVSTIQHIRNSQRRLDLVVMTGQSLSRCTCIRTAPATSHQTGRGKDRKHKAAQTSWSQPGMALVPDKHVLYCTNLLTEAAGGRVATTGQGLVAIRPVLHLRCKHPLPWSSTLAARFFSSFPFPCCLKLA